MQNWHELTETEILRFILCPIGIFKDLGLVYRNSIHQTIPR